MRRAGAAGGRHEQLRCQRGPERGVHPVHRIANAHRAHGVAVVPVSEREEFAFPGPSFTIPILDRHLHGHLSTNGGDMAASKNPHMHVRSPNDPAGHLDLFARRVDALLAE